MTLDVVLQGCRRNAVPVRIEVRLPNGERRTVCERGSVLMLEGSGVMIDGDGAISIVPTRMIVSILRLDGRALWPRPERSPRPEPRR